MIKNRRSFDHVSNARDLVQLLEEDPDIEILAEIQKVMMSLGTGKNLFGFSRSSFTKPEHAWIIELQISMMPKALIVKTSAKGTKIVEIRPQLNGGFEVVYIYFADIFPLMVNFAPDSVTRPILEVAFIENPYRANIIP